MALILISIVFLMLASEKGNQSQEQDSLSKYKYKAFALFLFLITGGSQIRSSICIQLLLFQNNTNNVYLNSFPVTLEFLELSYRNSIKRNQEAHLIFTQKTPTLYQWTTSN